MQLLRYLFALIILGALAVIINRLSVPDHNTAATHFDTIVVLGSPASPDGSPSLQQREKVSEAIREYKSGAAPNIIMTGGAAHNQFVEAHVMAAFAATQGIPPSAIIEEPRAQNTIQNIFYSSQIMRSRSWNSAEVISSPAHVGRAALILQATAKAHPDLAISWRTHPSPWPAGYSWGARTSQDVVEAIRCLQIRVLGFPKSPFLPNG